MKNRKLICSNLCTGHNVDYPFRVTVRVDLYPILVPMEYIDQEKFTKLPTRKWWSSWASLSVSQQMSLTCRKSEIPKSCKIWIVVGLYYCWKTTSFTDILSLLFVLFRSYIYSFLVTQLMAPMCIASFFVKFHTPVFSEVFPLRIRQQYFCSMTTKQCIWYQLFFSSSLPSKCQFRAIVILWRYPFRLFEIMLRCPLGNRLQKNGVTALPTGPKLYAYCRR